MLGFLIGLFLLGLVAGFIARLFVRSPTRLGCLGTALLGIIGSYAGGTIGALVFDQDFDIRRASTFLGAIGGSMVVLAIWRAFAGSRDQRDLRRRGY